MATTAGDPTAAGEPAASSSAPAGLPHHSTPRISHIVRTYLDLSSTSKKRRTVAGAAPKNQPRPAGTESAAAGESKGCGPSGAASLQPSRLLRELGVRVSRYTHEERRDVITRYMLKRGGRQGASRAAAAKVPSRQALAERRRRGAGGKFLSKEEEAAQTADKPEEKAEEEEPELPPEVVANAGGVPIVGMVFENEEKAYRYYVSYAGDVGFSVRKGLWDKTAKSGTKSRFYVCSREGFLPKNPAKRPCSETRTGCPARLSVKLTSSGKYRVTEFVQDHNHELAGPFDIGMLKSKRVSSKVQSGNGNAINIPPGYRNYLRTKSTKDMNPGDLRALTDYFRSMKSDNPSFYYAIQVDENDKPANVFWADARSISDYHYFSDVICFDMTYKLTDYSRPLALFLGMNHHRQMVIFGTAFLYDETAESFKWLLETFKSAMCGKQPKTILTDRSADLKEALALTWPGTAHRSCVWQIYQNAVKSLAHVFSISEEFTYDFSHCVFDVEDGQEFVETWNVIMEKYNLKENKLLNELYGDRENWALPYGGQIFSGDIKYMLRAETFGIRIKEYLGCEKELSPFLKFYQSSVEKRRQEEIQADYQASQGAPRTPLPLLWQAANLYTPITFELFRKEYEHCIDCMAYSCDEFGSYMITVKSKTKQQLVQLDSSDGTVACTCKKFETAGILCCHILKVYELRTVKEIPPQYFLKRWSKDAKLGTIDEIDGFYFGSDTGSSVPERYAALCRLFYNIAAKAATNVETFALVASQSDQLIEGVECTLQSTLADKSSVVHSIRAQLTRMVQNDYPHNGSSEAQKSIGKKKSEVARRGKGLETNKRQKRRKGPCDEAAGPRDGELTIAPDSMQTEPRTAMDQLLPDQLMHRHYVHDHNFGLSTSHNLHADLDQFSQASTVPTLQQQPFPGNGQLTQAYPDDMHVLQFMGTNPQIDQESGDQGESSIPVWDFL